MSLFSILFLLFHFSPFFTPFVEQDTRVERRSERIYDLRGIWKFSIGDAEEWNSPDFNDSDWEDMFVPSSWEDKDILDMLAMPGIEKK